jgi:hypothetical protein
MIEHFLTGPMLEKHDSNSTWVTKVEAGVNLTNTVFDTADVFGRLFRFPWLLMLLFFLRLRNNVVLYFVFVLFFASIFLGCQDQ